jgi:hypothetical protein
LSVTHLALSPVKQNIGSGSKVGPINTDGSKLGVVDDINVSKLLGPSLGICEGTEVGILDGALLHRLEADTL